MIPLTLDSHPVRPNRPFSVRESERPHTLSAKPWRQLARIKARLGDSWRDRLKAGRSIHEFEYVCDLFRTFATFEDALRSMLTEGRVKEYGTLFPQLVELPDPRADSIMLKARSKYLNRVLYAFTVGGLAEAAITTAEAIAELKPHVEPLSLKEMPLDPLCMVYLELKFNVAILLRAYYDPVEEIGLPYEVLHMAPASIRKAMAIGDIRRWGPIALCVPVIGEIYASLPEKERFALLEKACRLPYKIRFSDGRPPGAKDGADTIRARDRQKREAEEMETGDKVSAIAKVNKTSIVKAMSMVAQQKGTTKGAIKSRVYPPKSPRSKRRL